MPGLTTLTEREGIAGIALLAMFSDGVIAPEEDEVLRAHLNSYPPFEDTGERALGEILTRLESLARERGEAALLDMSCAAVPPRLAALAFLVAADIIAADGEVVLEESTFLRSLVPRLKLSEAQASKILRDVESRA